MVRKFEFFMSEAMDNEDIYLHPEDYQEFPSCCGATIVHGWSDDTFDTILDKIKDSWKELAEQWQEDESTGGEDIWSERKQRYITAKLQKPPKPKMPSDAYFKELILKEFDKGVSDCNKNHHIYVVILNQFQKWMGDRLISHHQFRLVSDRVVNRGRGGNRLYVYLRDIPLTPKEPKLKKRTFG